MRKVVTASGRSGEGPRPRGAVWVIGASIVGDGSCGAGAAAYHGAAAGVCRGCDRGRGCRLVYSRRDVRTLRVRARGSMKRRSSVRWSGALIALCLVVAASAGARHAGARQAGDGPAAPASGRSTAQTFRSAALGRTMPFLVYTPPGYDESDDRRYPVLYMLHGLGGSYRSWQEYGLLAAEDRLIRA